MKINYKFATVILLAVVAALLVTIGVLAGNTDSPEAPTHADAQMYTLEQIHELLTAGRITDPKMDEFTEPASGPGSTMNTLDEIMTAAQDNRCHCECAGCTLHGTRWCDNGDGTVTDLLGHSGVGQCLEWAQNASWGGRKPWRNASINDDDAHTRASAYGAEDQNWRLPTRAELYALTHGTEETRCSSGPCDVNGFTGVQAFYYWSSTSRAGSPAYAWLVRLVTGDVYRVGKYNDFYVWPVRSGQ